MPDSKVSKYIKKVWEVDPLLCPKCGGETNIVSIITEADVVCNIVTHQELWEERMPVERLPLVKISERHYGPFGDGWPGYEVPHTRCIEAVGGVL